MPKRKPNLSPEEQKALAAEAVKRMDDVRQAMTSPEAREDYLDFIINFGMQSCLRFRLQCYRQYLR